MAVPIEDLLPNVTQDEEIYRRHLEDEATRLRRLEESLSQLPGLADAQRETMVAVGRQLDELRTAGDRNATSLSSVGDALSGLQESTGAATDAQRGDPANDYEHHS